MFRATLQGFLVIAAIALASCGKESCPYQDERMCDRHYRDSIANLIPDTTGNGTQLPDTGVVVGNRVVFNPSVVTNIERVSFLEYYTGFRCQNCPPASATAKNVKNSLGNRLVLSFNHVTSTFAAPIAAPPAPYSTDFRTSEGEIYVGTFQISGLPNGTVNRKNFGTGYSTAAGDWLDRIQAENTNPAEAFLRIRKIEYNPANRSARVQIAYRITNGYPADYNLTIGATENGIVEAQKNGTQDLYPYTHDYVFRGNFNGLYGEELTAPSPALQSGETVLKEFQITLPNHWDEQEITLMAYINHRNSRMVIQATSRKLLP